MFERKINDSNYRKCCSIIRDIIQIIIYLSKRYFRIDQHLARHFECKVECLSSPPPFLCSQIIIPFLNSMTSTNQEKGLDFETLVPYSCSSVETLLYIHQARSISVIFKIVSTCLCSNKIKIRCTITVVSIYLRNLEQKLRGKYFITALILENLH